MQLRIAFDQSQDPGWTGGIVYMQNLLGAIDMLDAAERPFTLLIDRRGGVACKARANGRVELPPDGPAGLLKRISRKLKLPQPRPGITALLAREKVDLLFTDKIYSASLGVPLIAWIPDFQFMHLPESAGLEQVRFCTDLNNGLIKQSKSLVVSSNDVRKDLALFAPAATGRAHVVRFVAQIPQEIYNTDPAFVCDKYSLPQRFFFLPNQFWIHKNHLLVIEALAILAKRSVDINVVCTGNTFDQRHPDFFHSILQSVAIAGVHDRFRILGLIQRADVFQLERQSLAILQPSLFEGWSTSIEEAKSLGKRVVCSDLAVNKEQIPEADFFARHDAESLADCLEHVARQAQPGPDFSREADCRVKLTERTKEFARQFLTAARWACGLQG